MVGVAKLRVGGGGGLEDDYEADVGDTCGCRGMEKGGGGG
jgi:hypothetical protein